MARVNATEVRAIMLECDPVDATVELYIEAGTLVIDRVFATNTTLSTELLKEIERYFVAHMIANINSRNTIEEKLGDASVRFHDSKGEGLNSTPYGQMVLLLDSLGLMANMGKMAASIYAVNEFDNSTEI